MTMFKKGDYVYIKKIGIHNEELSYISILDNYIEDERIVYEIASILATDIVSDDCYEMMYYHSSTDNIVEIRLATPEEKIYLDNYMYDDGIKFDSTSLKLISLY